MPWTTRQDQPLSQASLAPRCRLRRAGIDEFDVARFDERAARWLIDARGATLAEEHRDPKALIAELRQWIVAAGIAPPSRPPGWVDSEASKPMLTVSGCLPS